MASTMRQRSNFLGENRRPTTPTGDALLSRKRLRRSVVPILILAIFAESIGVLLNITSIMPLISRKLPSTPQSLFDGDQITSFNDSSTEADDEPNSIKEFETPNLRVGKQNAIPPRVMFLGSDQEYFSSVMGRRVDDVWQGTREVGYDPHGQRTVEGGVLRNPRTLDNRDGTNECVPAAEWQTRHYPTCNAFHETQMQFEKEGTLDGTSLALLGIGTSRDAWKLKKKGESVVLKTLQLNREFNGLTYHFQILDAIISERLTSSKYVNNIYGFCGYSAMNELGKELELEWGLTIAQRLRYSRDLAAGMADAHGIEGDNKPLLVHADLRHSNVMFSYDTGKLTLSDFNQGYFLGWNKERNEMCGYRPQFSYWHDRFAAPEECLEEPQTDKTDVYHLGGMLFYFMTGYKPYTFNIEDFRYREKEKKMPDGKWIAPVVPPRLDTCTDPTVEKYKKAVQMCLREKPSDRATAREVFQLLDDALEELEKRTDTAEALEGMLK